MGTFARRFAASVAFVLLPLSTTAGFGQTGVPREAAATRTVQLLYPGHYSGIFVAHRHFFPLARDYSNLDAAVDFIRDETARRRMAAAAYEEIICNETYWIEHFVARFDALVTGALAGKPAPAATRLPLRRGIRRQSVWNLLWRGWLLLPPPLRTALAPFVRRLKPYWG